MFAQWGLPHCAFFDKRKRGENAVNENQEKTTAEVVTLEKTQPASEFVLEMTDIEKQFPGVKALDHAKLRLRPGTVHALMGENGAGKSTLMKCLFGIYKQDGGEIRIDGQSVHFTGPKNAMENGVAMVHQELNQVLQRSVMENIWLGRFPKISRWCPLTSETKMYTATKEVFDELDVHVDPKTVMSRMPVSQRQMVEIAKAVSYKSKVIVFDEPTSSLTEEEVEHLFRIINMLRSRGCGIIYISHKMEEILRISDEVTIMRDGQWIATRPAKELTMNEIIRLMVGRELTNRYPEKDNVIGETLLEVKGLTAVYSHLKDVSFEAKRGEILGVAGLDGSGRTELLENIFGIAKRKEGEIYLHGKRVLNRSARESLANKFAMLTEERRATGIFAIRDIQANTTISSLKRYKVGPFLSEKKLSESTDWGIQAMRTKTPSQKTQIRSLSGGNQQKVVIARWLETKPEILILNDPTRGIDVGAKAEIYRLMEELCRQGMGIIMISSELQETLSMADRILVMSEGRVTGEVPREEATQENLMKLAVGGKG